jgi:hypothetical protein
MGILINLFRALVLVLFVLFLLVLLNPSVEAWFFNKWDILNDRYENVNRFLKDSHYDVPPVHRRPVERMKDFYNNVKINKYKKAIINSNQKQNGSIMFDGTNEDLKESNFQWKNGVITPNNSP